MYNLKLKSDAFKKFREWHSVTTNQMERKLKFFRIGNGLEFLSEQFENFCRTQGKSRHKTMRATLQQNGVTERMNRTLLERVKCLLLNSGLPKVFWGEDVTTAAYLINRSPHSVLDFKTHMEIWHGEPADYSNLKVFGCCAFVHLKQDKLEPRAVRCVFLGYPEGVKGYRLWCTEPGKQGCIISRDVVFDEICFPYLAERMSQNQRGKTSENNAQVEVELQVKNPR